MFYCNFSIHGCKIHRVKRMWVNIRISQVSRWLQRRTNYLISPIIHFVYCLSIRICFYSHQHEKRTTTTISMKKRLFSAGFTIMTVHSKVIITMWYSVIRTTFDVQLHGQVDLWLGVHLTFVYAGVSLLYKLHLQVPLFAVFRVHDAEPPVTGVRVDAGRQDMQVSFPHPRHLKQERKTNK